MNYIAKQTKFLPYALVGILVFAFNGNTDANPYLQVYLILLEAKLSVALIYFLTEKLRSIHKAN